MRFRQRAATAGAIIGAVAGAVAAFTLVGREARLVDVLTIFFTAFGAGASLVVAVHGRRSRPRERQR